MIQGIYIYATELLQKVGAYNHAASLSSHYNQ